MRRCAQDTRTRCVSSSASRLRVTPVWHQIHPPASWTRPTATAGRPHTWLQRWASRWERASPNRKRLTAPTSVSLRLTSCPHIRQRTWPCWQERPETRQSIWLEYEWSSLRFNDDLAHIYVQNLVWFNVCDLFFWISAVCRNVSGFCAATVNRTSPGGTSVTARFTTWQLMTARIYWKTSVSDFLFPPHRRMSWPLHQDNRPSYTINQSLEYDTALAKQELAHQCNIISHWWAAV